MGSGVGLFVGIATLDLGYLVAAYPEEDTKTTADDVFMAAGGPAANAAVAFSFLAGGRARLLTGLGRHALADQVRDDLDRHGIELVDALPEHDAPPPLSCITINRRNGSRTVVSLDASRLPHLTPPLLTPILKDVEVVLTDGHLIGLSIAVARAAVESGVPVVLDGGRWRDGTDELLGYVDAVICSRAFEPPGATGHETVHNYLLSRGVPMVATTNGADPIAFATVGANGQIPVPGVTVLDTLGAGDIFHGAFCYYFIRNGGHFVKALQDAAIVASGSCAYFGTREWMSRASVGPRHYPR